MNAAFKEWAVVCEALGTGLQSIIIRKGGIAEGKAGFAFRHDDFCLFPTWFHEQLEKTTLPAGTAVPEEPGENLEIRYTATIEWSGLVKDWKTLENLREFHVLHQSVLEERFRYDDTEGVHVAFVRVYRLDPPVRLANEKKYGGCRSWIELPIPEGVALVSVLTDEEHSRRRRRLDEVLAGTLPSAV
ncbi:MAG TPA: DUF1802 family protein [Terrimicrobiaceae bacterium]|nr:DUF1802 family protein [Terrimicrobiaceae bacterium]